MQLRSRISATVCFLACACTAGDPESIAYATPQAIEEVHLACAGLDKVDTARLASATPDWRPFDRFHAQARQGIKPLPILTSDIVLKLAIPGGSIPAPYGTSVFAAQQPDGRWLVSHVRLRQLPPPPQPLGATPVPVPPERIVKTGMLRSEALDRIAAAIGSECYRHEPALSPASLPLLGGGTAECPPDGGHPNALEIMQNGNSRRYLRECGRTWATGIIMITLENPDNIIPQDEH